MEHDLVSQGYIPLDKSWMIRVGVLDLVNGYDDIVKFLDKQPDLSDDLKVLYNACASWKSSRTIDVGESGTLYRFLKFLSWKTGEQKEFILRGSLKYRQITDDPKIINYPLQKLLELDNYTSQWASAAVLLGKHENVPNPPYKMRLTYEAVSHWKERRENGKRWEPRFDQTINNQAAAFLKILDGKEASFVPEQAEDYCFARAFGFVTKDEGRKKWPSLVGHESDRIEEMERALGEGVSGKEVTSKDHRIVQAVSMKLKSEEKEVKVKFPSAVNKSWPQFWRFLGDSWYIGARE